MIIFKIQQNGYNNRLNECVNFEANTDWARPFFLQCLERAAFYPSCLAGHHPLQGFRRERMANCFIDYAQAADLRFIVLLECGTWSKRQSEIQCPVGRISHARPFFTLPLV